MALLLFQNPYKISLKSGENQGDYGTFSQEVLTVALQNYGTPRATFPVLAKYQQLLDENFGRLLCNWLLKSCQSASTEQKDALVGLVGNLAIAIDSFPLGRRWDNLEIAIMGYETVLELRPRDQYAELWAQTQNNLANAYYSRIRGDRGENIEQAIAAYLLALEVYTRDAFPEKWATTQNNLAIAYYSRIRGDRADNLEQAIKGYKNALEIRTKAAFPIDCLQSARNLGNLYFTEAQWQNAITAYDTACEAIENTRNQALDDDRRQEIIADSITVYENLIHAHIQLRQYPAAFAIVERTRSSRLVDLMNTPDP